jgi:hypothetical protein
VSPRAQPVQRHCERSEAIHSFFLRAAAWIASSLTLLAMTAKYTSAFPQRDAPEVLIAMYPLENRGRREDRVHAAPAVSCAKCTKRCAHEHTGSAEASGLPCAMALRLIARSPRRRIPFCHRRLQIEDLAHSGRARKISADLTSATDARTTRLRRTRLRRSSTRRPIAHGKPALRLPLRADAAASTASQPAFVTIAIRPSFG